MGSVVGHVTQNQQKQLKEASRRMGNAHIKLYENLLVEFELREKVHPLLCYNYQNKCL